MARLINTCTSFGCGWLGNGLGGGTSPFEYAPQYSVIEAWQGNGLGDGETSGRGDGFWTMDAILNPDFDDPAAVIIYACLEVRYV